MLVISYRSSLVLLVWGWVFFRSKREKECICCGSNFSFVLNFSNQFNFCFSLSLIMVIDFRQRKVKIKLVWKILKQGKIWTTTYSCMARFPIKDLWTHVWQTLQVLIYLTINEWGWVSCEELWRSRRELSVEAVGRGG